MSRKILKVLVLVSVFFSFISCGKKDANTINIGISQIVEHPALDSARDGFLEVIYASEFKDRIEVEARSAQGDMSIAQSISRSFVDNRKDLILAIATPSAQAAYNATKEIPILITAVTDPKSAGLTGSNISGTSDASPTDRQLELLKRLLPNSKRIGFVYNMSEQNSEIQAKNLKEIASFYNLEVDVIGITNVNEMSQALDIILPRIDVLYTPADNLVASSMPLIVEKSIQARIPIIGAESAHVESGALATEGINYYNLGRQTGEMALEVLRGKEISQLKIGTLNETELIINTKSADLLGISIDYELLKEAKLI